jgi:hypothetical protein
VGGVRERGARSEERGARFGWTVRDGAAEDRSTMNWTKWRVVAIRCSSDGDTTASALVLPPMSVADHARSETGHGLAHVRVIAVHRRVHRADLRSKARARGAEAREEGGTKAEDRHGELGGARVWAVNTGIR